jgi:hypothetical protein
MPMDEREPIKNMTDCSAGTHFCPDMSALLDRWRHATVRYMNAVMGIQIHVGASTNERFDALRSAAEAARVATEEAMLAADRHRKEHGCH